MPAWIVTLLSWLAAAVIGAVYGVAGTIAHASMWGPVPIGMIIAAIGCVALLVAVRALIEDRIAALACGIGMLAMLLLFSGRGPGGSIIVEAGVIGQVWMWLLLALVAVVVLWPEPRARRDAPDDASGVLADQAPAES